MDLKRLLWFEGTEILEEKAKRNYRYIYIEQ